MTFAWPLALVGLAAIPVLAEAGPGHGWIALCAARPEFMELFRVC